MTQSRIEDFMPATRLTDQQKREIQRQQSQQRPGFGQAVEDAVLSEWISSWALRQMRQTGQAFDPDFELTDDLVKQLGEGLDDDMIPRLGQAVSFEHAQVIRDQLLDVQERRQRLASLGWGGAALRMGAAMFDPVAMAVAAGGFWAGGAAVYGANLTRAQRFMRAGMLAAGTEGAIESYLASQDPDRGVRDVMWTGLGSFALGGVGGMWAGTALQRAAVRAKKDLEFAELLRSRVATIEEGQVLRVNGLTDKGRAYFREQLDPKRYQSIVDDVVAKSGLDPDMDAGAIARLRESMDAGPGLLHRNNDPLPDQPPSAQAMPEGKIAGDLDLSHVSDAPAAMTRLRYSFASILGSSDAPDVRRAASAYADDALLKVDGSGGGVSASTWVTQGDSRTMARYYRESLPAMREWARAKGYKPHQMFTARKEFFDEVGNAIRRPPGEYTADPHINRVADLQRKIQRDMLMMVKRHGAKGFDAVDPRDTYLMRMWSPQAMNNAYARYGDEAVEQFFANAILRNSEQLDWVQAQRVAKGFTKTIRSLGDKSELSKSRLFSADSAEELAEVLRANVPGITESQIEDILYAVRPRGDGGTSPRARRRLGLDETYREQMPDGSWMSMESLMENNAELLMGLYSRQMHGVAAYTEVYRLFRTGPDDTIDTFQQLANRLRRSGATDRDIQLLETLDKHIRGIPLTKNDTSATVMRRLRAVSHIAMSGQFGVAQIGEVANIITEMGMRTIMQQIPALRNIFRRARGGQLSNQLLEEIETMIGLGTERLTGQVVNRFDATGGSVEVAGNIWDTRLRRTQRFANDVSFMAPINTILHRTAASTAAQRITNMAFGGKPMSARRLKQIGLDAQDAERIYAQIRKHATTQQGMLGRKLRRMNIDQWDDQQAAGRMINAIDRWARRAIQTQDIGNLPPFMTTDLAKTLFQFRSFMMGAWEKQFLTRVQFADWEAFASAMLNVLTAGLAYAGQQYALSIGRKDQEQVLAQRLAPDQIIKAAVQRAAWSSLLPGTIDTAGYLLGQDPVFTFRHSGLNTDFFFGSPVTSMVNLAARGVRGTAQAGLGVDDFDQTDMKAWTQITPFSRAFGIKNMLDAITAELPE